MFYKYIDILRNPHIQPIFLISPSKNHIIPNTNPLCRQYLQFFPSLVPLTPMPALKSLPIPLLPSLLQQGFTSPTIEESIEISGFEQNRLIVAAQVRDSLVQSNSDSEIVSVFDTSGAELLYEIRLLRAKQRASTSLFIIENLLDAKTAQDLARAMKDFPRRRGD